MSEQYPKVLDADAQLRAIEPITSVNKYIRFYRTFFIDRPNTFFEESVRAQVPEDMAEKSADYMRFLGLVSILGAQFAPSLAGHPLRLEEKGIEMPAFHPLQLWALAAYLGSVNHQVTQMRDERYSQISDQDPELALGVYGLMPNVKKGKVEPLVHMEKETLTQFAEIRYTDSRPICLPTRELNATLHRVNFTALDASKMPRQEFIEEFYPQAEEILKPYIDNPENVFFGDVEDQFPFPSPVQE